MDSSLIVSKGITLVPEGRRIFPDMTVLEKVIYLADFIEPTRDFPGVDALRRTVWENLDRGLLMGLEMTVEEAMNFFENIPKIYRKIKTLYDVGLGYVKLGQSATTLSGGEAQRVKLATELSRHSTGKTAYILDEPTTGLHTADVHRLIDVLQKFVDNGNTVIVIEHNLDVIKTADHIIDLGPEGGNGGGEIVVTGTPEEVAECERSYTGKYLKDILKR